MGPNAGDLMEGGPEFRGAYGRWAQMLGNLWKVGPNSRELMEGGPESRTNLRQKFSQSEKPHRRCFWSLDYSDHISESIHHRPQVLYIFGILGSRPPPSCIQIAIWAPHPYVPGTRAHLPLVPLHLGLPSISSTAFGPTFHKFPCTWAHLP